MTEKLVRDMSVSMLKVEAAIKIVYTVNREVKRSGNL
jgi:hypothetical protein